MQPLAQVAEGYRAMDEPREIETLLRPWRPAERKSSKVRSSWARSH